MSEKIKKYQRIAPKTQGDGYDFNAKLKSIGSDVVIEDGVRIFHPESVMIGSSVYIGHEVILKGYYKGYIEIENNCWLGQGCFLHGAGGITIKNHVGIAPYVKILTSSHDFDNSKIPVISCPLRFAKVVVGVGADIGMGSIILPGVNIGDGAVIGAGSVVTNNIPNYEVWAGSPAKKLRNR